MRRSIVPVALLAAAPLVVAVASAWAQDAKPAEAKPAPAIALKDTEGKDHTLEQYKDKIVVLEWTEPGCPYIVRHAKAQTMKKIQADYKDKNVVVLGVCTSRFTDAAKMKEFCAEHKIDYPVLMDTTGSVGRAYGASNTPHLFVVNQGKIVYSGAIDNDPKGTMKDGVKNHVRDALDEIIAKKPVTTASTKPYG